MVTNKIMHRDIKPDNIFLYDNNMIKIGDFGFAKIGVDLTKTKLGTPLYSSPEILDGMMVQGYNNLIDLWSLGVVFYEMLNN